MTKLLLMAAAAWALQASAPKAAPADPVAAWRNPALSPDQRAEAALKAMTLDEKIALLHGPFAVALPGGKPPTGAIGSAGFIPGNARLGVPALQESDASLGVANPLESRPGDYATPLPSGLALAASFDPSIAYEGGAMIAREARAKGLNVLLAGGANLARDPRNGRNFEYLGEDPLLAGTLDGASIRGIQDQHVLSTLKHFAVNDQETGRMVLNARIEDAAARESDLLAFEIALETGRPGAVMCAYNKVNGPYACASDPLLNGVLKGDWRYPGFVMSDWGAVHATSDLLAGLDQESGQSLDKAIFFDAPLKAASSNPAYRARIDDAARRILRSIAAVGLVEHPPAKGPMDEAADLKVAEAEAEAGAVLLKNCDALLPLAQTAQRILVIGGHADFGVLSGGGSSQVTPRGGGLKLPLGGQDFIEALLRNTVYDPSSPLLALKHAAPAATVSFYDGRYASEAALRAKAADVVIVLATQWMGEGEDAPDLTLPGGQDGLISAVAAANPKTVVVLETGGPVLMPWLERVGAVVEAWYPGAGGGVAIARLLTGQADFQGRLPITFPASTDQLPRPNLPGLGLPKGQVFDVDYAEGSDVGYRWFAAHDRKPLFPFGYGLSYTRFRYGELTVTGGRSLSASLSVANVGDQVGVATPQLYAARLAGRRTRRLLGWSKAVLQPGERRTLSFTVDPRLLADFDTTAQLWRIEGGDYTVVAGGSAEDDAQTASTTLRAQTIRP